MLLGYFALYDSFSSIEPVTSLVGCVVVGVIASILAYFLSLYIFQR